LKRCSALLACAFACARTSAPPPGPAPAAVEPAGSYAGRETSVVLRGERFTPAAAQRLNGGGGIAVDADFRAFLGTDSLDHVRWLDSRTLTAVVPADLPVGIYGLSVEGPYGRGDAENAFRVWAGPPAALSATASAPQTARAGDEFTISQTVSNIGGMTALTVAARTPVLSGPAVALQPPAEIVDIPAGGSQDFVWRIRASGPGVLQIALPVAGVDEVDGQTVATEASASITVVTTASLTAAAQPVPASVPVGVLVQLALDVVNAGGTDALAVQLDDPAGSANVRVVSSPAPQDVPAGQVRTFQWTVQGTAAGTALLGCGGNGTDAGNGAPIPVAPVQWQPIDFQPASGLDAALVVPPGVLPGETFNLTLTVTNPGTSAALTVQPELALSGAASSSAVLQSSPLPADIGPGKSVPFTWTYTAGAAGALDVEASAAGTDAGTGAWLAGAATGSTQVSDAAPVAQDPFADGTGFSYVFAYANRVYLGPSADGTRAVRVNPDGTGAETVRFGFVPDPAGVDNAATPPATGFPSLGYRNCTPDTLQCGPDNEDGRALFVTFASAGKEWLFAAGGRQSSVIKHAYVTSDTSAAPSFPFTRLNLSGGMRGATAAALFGSTLYVGIANGGGSGSPGILPIASPFNSSSVGSMMSPDALTSPAGTGLIDSMAVYTGLLYVANAGGCANYDGLFWADCTPSGGAWNLTPVTTSKTSDFTPADKAVPQMAVLGGNLYLARNTTAGPQLWICTPSLFACDDLLNPWSLFAPNGTENRQLSQFDDPALGTVSMLVATSQHLYVGYDAPGGVALYRSSTAYPASRADFVPWATTGLGGGVTQILDAQALTFAGKDYVYVTARPPNGPVQVYRLAR
jgi:hypothetical protein